MTYIFHTKISYIYTNASQTLKMAVFWQNPNILFFSIISLFVYYCLRYFIRFLTFFTLKKLLKQKGEILIASGAKQEKHRWIRRVKIDIQGLSY